MIKAVSSKIRAQIVNGKTVKLGLALIQVIIVFYLPLRTIKARAWMMVTSSTEKFYAFFVLEEQWKQETLTWRMNDFSDFKIISNLGLVEFIWFLAISGFIVNELFGKKSIFLRIITIQGQMLFLAYSILSLTLPLKETHFDMVRYSNHEFIFTAYYWMAVLIGTLIVLIEINELKRQKLSETFHLKIFLISNLYALILGLLYVDEFNSLIIEFLDKNKSFFGNYVEIEGSDSLIRGTLLFGTITISLYIYSEREKIIAEAEKYFFFSFYSIIGWWAVFKSSEALINDPFMVQIIEFYSLFIIATIIMIWFLPIVIYDIKNGLEKMIKRKKC
jgi:hypothetical protein